MGTYQMYRATTLGSTLQETLDELVQNGQITASLALKVISNYDKVINKALSSRVKARFHFKAKHLKTYRFCDNVWTFVLEDVEFKDSGDFCSGSKVKIVACDGRSAAAVASSSSTGSAQQTGGQAASSSNT